MIFITQLIYIVDGQEQVFDEFESIAIPTILKYNGRLLLRVRPTENAFIENHIDKPYEIHLVEFETQKDFDNFKPVSYTHLRAHETGRNLVCRLLLEKKK